MKTERLFELIFIILEKKTVTAEELAKRFGVSVRTIYRDLDILSASGVPIYTQQGRNGGVRLMEQYALSKTLFTDAEQSQIVMALQSLKATGQEDVAAPLSKLKGIFQKNIDDWLEIDFSSWGNSEEDKKLFSMIRESILNSRTLRFSYTNTKGESGVRTVEPYKLVFKGQSWYLFAYCRAKRDFRFFKLSRIQAPQAGEDSFERECRQTYGNDGGQALYKGKKLTVKLKIDAKAAYRVLDEFKGDILETGEDYFIVESHVEDGAWLTGYLLGFGDSIEVLEPPALRRRYIETVKDMLNKNKE